MTREEKRVFAKLGVYDHVHEEARGCTCFILADEPREDCPMHGAPWPPRCGSCGQFLPWKKDRLEPEGVLAARELRE